jgi:biopolymer transport protein ExbD/biopolymer transport protein TolR
MNVTPLVDVVLVLLIIFMVVAPQLQRDVQVNLPGIFNPDPDVEANVDAIKVTVNAPGSFTSMPTSTTSTASCSS